MKYQITISILFDLLAGKKTTAKTIAEKYGVSERTAHRYVSVLSECVPLSIKRGRSGGIYLSDTYKLPVGFLTESEYKAIDESLSLAYEQSAEKRFLEAKRKLSLQVKQEKKDFSLREHSGTILIDGAFGDLYSFTQKYNLLKGCMQERKIVQIDYLSERGERSKRKIEPHLLVFSDGVWKLYAFCHTDRDFRLFFLGRILSAFRLEERYRPRPFQEEEVATKLTTEDCVEVRLEIEPSSLIETQNRLGVENFRFKNGVWTANVFLPKTNLVGNILSLGQSVKVLSPDFLKEEIVQTVRSLSEKY